MATKKPKTKAPTKPVVKKTAVTKKPVVKKAAAKRKPKKAVEARRRLEPILADTLVELTEEQMVERLKHNYKQRAVRVKQEQEARDEAGLPPYFRHILVDQLQLFGIADDGFVYKWDTATGAWKLHKDGV